MNSYNANRHHKSNKLQKIAKLTLIVLVILVALLGLSTYFSKHSTNKVSSSIQVPAVMNTQLSAAESGLLPWSLQAPLSRMAVYQGQDANHLIIAGGLTAGGTSARGIYRLNITNGNLSHQGNLPNQVHDAASSMLNQQYALFGGGTSNSVNTAQVFNSSGAISASGTLPQLRSDAAAAVVGNTSYIIGGYNGTTADPEILTTTNGKQFSNYGNLPIPVRYAAVVSVNKGIFIFGGMAIGGQNSGNPIKSVQYINTQTHKISVLSWQLPVPIEGASAFVLNNELFVAGGQSTVTQNIPLGVGTTQVPGVAVKSNSLTQNTIWAVDVSTGKFLYAGRLQLPVAYSGVTTIGNRAWLVGGEYNGQVVASVQMVTPNAKFGTAGAPGAGSPYYGGKLMVADRGNNRIVVMNPAMQLVWKFPSSSSPASVQQGFYFPDDAFFTNHGTGIISNQENNNTIVQISYPAGKIVWTFGHPLQAGSAYGYLRAPDDAYLLKNGNVVVADDQNCRVLFINPAGKVVGQIGTTDVCVHQPNVSLGSPNGDTPLFDGNILISEIIGSWVSEYTPAGKMVWAVHLPISYPSDPQQLGASATSNPNHYLIADYANPGSILQFTRQGKILSEYRVNSGPGRLNDPSLVEILPSGVYFANDDHRDRVVAIDPATGALVWQYGINDQPGISYGMLQRPDGFDLLMANGTTPTHLATE